MKIIPSKINLLIIILSALVLSTSLYMQYVLQLNPCPLCLMQRMSVILILIFGLIGLFRHKTFQRTILFFTATGFFFAGRQLWLLSLPNDQTPACLPGLDILIQYFAWSDIARVLFLGSGECTESHDSFLGLSLPMWSCVYFAIIAGILLLYHFKNKK